MRSVKSYLLGGSQRSQTLKKNAMGAMSVKAFSMLIDLVKVPIILSFLDAEHYGVFITITSIIYWTANFDFGLGAGLRYNLTESLSLRNIKRSRELTSTAYITFGLMMAVLFIICIPFLFILNWNTILNTSVIGSDELILSVAVILVSCLATYVLDLIIYILQADQKAAISTIFKPIANVLALSTILVLRIYSYNSLLLASLALTAPSIIVLGSASLVMFLNKYKVIAPSFKNFRRACVRDIFSLGLKYFVSQLSSLVVFSTAPIILSNLLEPSQAAIYTTGYTYFAIIVIFYNMLLTPFIASTTDAYVKREFVWLKECMRKLSFIALLASFGMLILLAVSQFAFKIWVGDKLTIPWPLCIIFTIYFICNIWSTTYNNFITGVGKFNVTVIVSAVKIVLFIPVAIALVKALGIIGLVLAIITVNTIPNIIFGFIQYRLIIDNKAKGIWNK